MRAFGSSVSGWHETSGRAIVNRMSAKSPRALRSAMCRSVASYALGRSRPDDVDAELGCDPLQLRRGHERHCAPQREPLRDLVTLCYMERSAP